MSAYRTLETNGLVDSSRQGFIHRVAMVCPPLRRLWRVNGATMLSTSAKRSSSNRSWERYAGHTTIIRSMYWTRYLANVLCLSVSAAFAACSSSRIPTRQPQTPPPQSRSCTQAAVREPSAVVQPITICVDEPARIGLPIWLNADLRGALVVRCPFGEDPPFLRIKSS